MNELALFSGAGGGILGGHMLGWKTMAACEIEDYPRETLLRRQLDGFLPRFPIWDDINTFDGTQFRGYIDIVSGGFPCQDISAAGKGAGIDGVRSGLWKEMHRIIGEVRPRFAFMENSPLLTSRGLGTVLGDLAEIGYDAEWCVLGADDIGAPHRRKRIWILAYTTKQGLSERSIKESEQERETNESERLCCEISDSMPYWKRRKLWESEGKGNIRSEHGTTESKLGRVANGVANRVDRLKAIGNGQVPAVAATAFLILYNRINNDTPALR